jgi:hypothetical protein
VSDVQFQVLRDSTAAVGDGNRIIVSPQEYVRYRVNRCTHQQARDRVFQQIDGRGIQPVC